MVQLLLVQHRRYALDHDLRLADQRHVLAGRTVTGRCCGRQRDAGGQLEGHQARRRRIADRHNAGGAADAGQVRLHRLLLDWRAGGAGGGGAGGCGVGREPLILLVAVVVHQLSVVGQRHGRVRGSRIDRHGLLLVGSSSSSSSRNVCCAVLLRVLLLTIGCGG